MAIISAGQVILVGQPLKLMESLRSRIWQATISRSQLADFEKQYNVVSNRLFMGKIVVNVFSNGRPGTQFEAIIPDLKDVYFCALKGWLEPTGAVQ